MTKEMLIAICCGSASIFFFGLGLVIMIYQKFHKQNEFDENEDESLLSLDENYHWTERCAGFDADDILNEIIKKLMAKKKKI